MLSHKEEIIAHELAKGKTQAEAYLAAFPNISKESAEASSSRYLKTNPGVRARAIEIIQEVAGLSIKDCLDGIKAGMNATYTNKYGEQVDYIARHEYIKTALRLHGELKDNNSINIDNRQVNIEFNGAELERMERMLDRMDKMRARDDVIDGEIVAEENGDRGGG